MAKKRLRLKPKFKYLIVLLIAFIIILNYGIKKYQQYLYEQTYEYKLTNIGYSLDDAKLIQEKLDNNDIDNLLNQEKNNKLLEFIKEKYFIKDNLDRYFKYQEINKKVSTKNIVTLVNVNRDNKYYEEIKNTDTTKNELMLVNKYYTLDEKYSPDDLVNISNLYSWGTGHKAKKAVFDAFLEMWEAAKEEGFYLMINSSYRTYQEQQEVYNSFVKSKSEKYADTIAARPGHSEHETGLCLDIFTKENSQKATFKDTEDYKWLKENSYKYGFILRYPEGKDNITGYNFESWHYRYVGKEVAKFIYENDLTFDEYYAYYIEAQKKN